MYDVYRILYTYDYNHINILILYYIFTLDGAQTDRRRYANDARVERALISFYKRFRRFDRTVYNVML